jgi:Flp pilus assembly protein TadG
MLRTAVMKFLPQRMARLAKDERGVSAVEFALLAPLMVTLYFGTVEVSQGIAAYRKVTLVARTVTDLTSRVSSVTKSDLDDILNASTTVLAPYPDSKAKVIVASLKIDANSNVTKEWSQSKPADFAFTMPTIPPALIVPNTYLIWSQVSYEYKPVVGYVVTGTLNLKDQMFMRPRLSEKVVGPAP